MYVVTGSARCGTSATMQTLVLLGIESPALPFIKEHKDIMDKNPKGFYEMNDEVKDGVHHDNYKGMAVKLFPGCLRKTPKKYISKMIVCKRDRDEAIASYEPIRKITEINATSAFIYDINYLILDAYITDVEHIFITFADMMCYPEVEIDRIITFLEIHPSKEQISNAIKNIDKWQY